MIFNPFPAKPPVTQWFGENPSHYAQYGMKGHNGIDFGVPIGTPVFAPHEGYVHLQDEGNFGYGKHIIITSRPYKLDGTCRSSTLAHLSAFGVSEGQFLSSEDVLGWSGNTGDSTGPHCHWTYKLRDNAGNALNHGNGFLGAIDLAPLVNGKRSSHVQLWNLGFILS